MKYLMLLVVATLLSLGNGSVSYAQDYCNSDEDLFLAPQAEAVLIDTIVYATNQKVYDDFGFNTKNLSLDLHYPDLPQGEVRPLIVLVHGGGFIGGTRSEMNGLSEVLAALGYVVANIDYRLCETLNCQLIAINPCGFNNFGQLRTARYIATLDALHAAEYLIQNASQYHIDPNNIIMGGASAGAVTALTSAYMSQEEINVDNPGFESAWGTLPVIPAIKGVISLAGGLVHEMYIDSSDLAIPFMVHGTCDNVVFYDQGGAYGCNWGTVYGSASIAERLDDIGYDYHLFTGIGIDHNVLPLAATWLKELMNFLKCSVLCSGGDQVHNVVESIPSSNTCLLVNQPISSLAVQDTITDFECDIIATNNFISMENFVKVYPNPASDFLIFENKNEEELIIKISDLAGREIYTTISKEASLNLSIPDWNTGIYIIQIKSEQNIFSYKLLIE